MGSLTKEQAQFMVKKIQEQIRLLKVTLKFYQKIASQRD